MILVHFQGKPFNIILIQVYAPTTDTKKLKLIDSMRPTTPSRTNTEKDVLFIIGDWNAKVGSQEMPGITGKFGLGVQNEAGQKLTEFCQENALIIANTSSNNTGEDSTHGHHQMVSTEIRLIILFVPKDREALNSHLKQDWKLMVAQIMNSLLPNLD